jgi:non-heme chloroperoxidase
LNPPHPKTELEVLVHSPQRKTAPTPLLFVHGAFTSAWCWEERYLPFFAAAGFEAHAVSLSGHGSSRGREHLDSLSIADYVNDVREVADAMDTPPILIGHSMGGFVVQKYLEQTPMPAAVLMCSVPPQGLMSTAVDLMWSRPNLLTELNNAMAGSRDGIGSLRDAMFSQPISLDEMKRIYRHAQAESHRALWDMTLLNLPQPSRVKRTPLLVMGTALDQLIPKSAVEMTARTYDVDAEIFSGMGHGVMLEQDWQKPADRIVTWLGEHNLASPPKNGAKRK